jgi:hypothetical protein
MPLNKIFFTIIFVFFMLARIWAGPDSTQAKKTDDDLKTTLSFIYPGLGQFYTGERVKGITGMGVATAALAVLVTNGIKMNLYYKEYHDALPPQENFDRAYNNAERCRLNVNISVGVYAAVWLWSLWDAHR